ADGEIEVRGELVMLRSTFEAYNEAHTDKPLINPRNAAAGTVRAKDPAAVADRRLRLFALDLDAATVAQGGHDVEEALRKLGFDPAPMRHCTTVDEVLAAIGEIEAGRDRLDYDLDGAVVRLADREAYRAAGVRTSSPRGAIAYKFPPEERTTKLLDVVWD